MGEPSPPPSEAEIADLAALADGTLPEARRAAVEARVAASPELQELLERQREAVAAMRSLADEDAPPSLQAAVEARRRPRGRRRWTARRLLLPAAAGVLAAAIAVVVTVLVTSGPGTPTVAEVARFASQAPTEAAPRPVGDGARLAAEVDGVVFPDFGASYGWEAVGANRGELDGRGSTAVVYEKDGNRIAYAIVAGEALPRPPAGESTIRDGVLYQTLGVDGLTVVTWRREGRTCVLIGPAPADELIALASWQAGGALAS